MSIVAISSHLDDAALSASASLADAGSTVLTVFAGMPPDGFGVSLWDRVTGASSSAARQAERLAEDAEVMRLLSARGCYLDEREAQFREAGSAPDLDRLAVSIAAQFSASDELWLPAAIGKHPDHLIARDAGLRAAALTGHSEVVLYADFPYVIMYGWPDWVSGKPADPFLDAAPWVAREVTGTGLIAEPRSAEVITLSPAQRDMKAAIARAYRSQAGALNLTARELAAHPAKLDHELFWRVTR